MNQYRNCKTSALYCDFAVNLDSETVQIETCKFCHRSVRYNKKGGKVDNARYLRDHVRDFCQRTGPTALVYEEIYGRQHVKDRDQAIKEHEERQKRIKDYEHGAAEYVASWKKKTVAVKQAT